MNYALNIANVATSRKLKVLTQNVTDTFAAAYERVYVECTWLKAALEQGQKRTEELEAEVQKANEEIGRRR